MLREICHLWRIVLMMTRPLSDPILDFIYGLLLGKSKPLPDIKSQILLIPAVELAEKIRKRQLKCEEVMQAYVDRSKAVHPFLNAAVDERYEDALKEARHVDEFLVNGGQSEEDIARETPLLGVPFTCKETIGVKGMAQTDGLVGAKDHVAPDDSDTAALYRKAGAIPYVVSNVPELCMWWETANHVFGRTKNPYDALRTPGGSSGGEAVLISSAAALIGIGNDLAGSIRLPASFCGIYGHKPSRGVISNRGVFPKEDEAWDEMTSTGPMCRYAQDLHLTTRLLAGDHPRLKFGEKVNFKNVNVYYMEEIPGHFNSSISEVREAVVKAANHFQAEFDLQPIRAKVPELENAYMWEARMLAIKGDDTMISGMSAASGATVHPWWELTKNLFRCSDHTLPAIFFSLIEMNEKNLFYRSCLKRLRELEQRLEQLLQGDAILILPTQPEPAPHYLMTIPKFHHLGYTGIFNALGYPATQVPAGMVHGLPIGVQVVSRQYQDHLTVAAAVELDRLFGGWQSPCTVRIN